MRLIEPEINGIIWACENIFKKNNTLLEHISLYLFGSRTDDTLKGGDIDLLLRVPKEILENIKKLKLDIAREIKNNIGEQKIDILIIDQDPPKEAFHRLAIEGAVILKEWGKNNSDLA